MLRRVFCKFSGTPDIQTRPDTASQEIDGTGCSSLWMHEIGGFRRRFMGSMAIRGLYHNTQRFLLGVTGLGHFGCFHCVVRKAVHHQTTQLRRQAKAHWQHLLLDVWVWHQFEQCPGPDRKSLQDHVFFSRSSGGFRGIVDRRVLIEHARGWPHRGSLRCMTSLSSSALRRGFASSLLSTVVREMKSTIGTLGMGAHQIEFCHRGYILTIADKQKGFLRKVRRGVEKLTGLAQCLGDGCHKGPQFVRVAPSCPWYAISFDRDPVLLDKNSLGMLDSS